MSRKKGGCIQVLPFFFKTTVKFIIKVNFNFRLKMKDKKNLLIKSLRFIYNISLKPKPVSKIK